MKRRCAPRHPRRDDGVILLTMLFVMIVVGLVAALLSDSLGSRLVGGSLGQLARQAQFAATAGVEWGRGRAVGAGVCGTAQITIGEFDVNVSCNATAVTDGALAYNVFDVQAEARHGSYGDADFARWTELARFDDR